jgi:hypothetical protein
MPQFVLPAVISLLDAADDPSILLPRLRCGRGGTEEHASDLAFVSRNAGTGLDFHAKKDEPLARSSSSGEWRPDLVGSSIGRPWWRTVAAQEDKARGEDERLRENHGSTRVGHVHLRIYRAAIVYKVQVEYVKLAGTNLDILLTVG